jgi:hypothetical protein
MDQVYAGCKSVRKHCRSSMSNRTEAQILAVED